jgi:hypothetical protein
VSRVAGVIFKECLIENRPTLKASNSPDKSTLPGRLQLFRGSDKDGNYIGDLIGLDEEEVKIPGAASVERLLVPFWENGHHDAIPSITKQKAFIEEQRGRFKDLNNYPCGLSDRLRALRDELTAKMREDGSGWREVLSVPQRLAEALRGMGEHKRGA